MSEDCNYCGANFQCSCKESVELFYKNLYERFQVKIKYVIDDINEEIQTIKEHAEYMEDPFDLACATGQMNAYEHCKTFINESMSE